MYDSRIGRWTAPDPEGQFDSPYVSMGNNPVSTVDPDGGWMFSFAGAAIGAAVGGSIGGAVSEGNGGSFWKGFGIGAAIGAVAGGVIGGIGDNPGQQQSTASGHGWNQFRANLGLEGERLGYKTGPYVRGGGATFTGVLEKDFFQMFSSGEVLNSSLQVTISASRYMVEGSFSNTIGKLNVSLDLYRGKNSLIKQME